MAEPTEFGRILRAAQDDLVHVDRLLAAHMRKCESSRGCADCRSLEDHRYRARRQLELLAPPAQAEMEALF